MDASGGFSDADCDGCDCHDTKPGAICFRCWLDTRLFSVRVSFDQICLTYLLTRSFAIPQLVVFGGFAVVSGPGSPKGVCFDCHLQISDSSFALHRIPSLLLALVSRFALLNAPCSDFAALSSSVSLKPTSSGRSSCNFHSRCFTHDVCDTLRCRSGVQRPHLHSRPAPGQCTVDRANDCQVQIMQHGLSTA